MFQKSTFTTIYTNYELKLLVKSNSAYKTVPQTSKSVPITKEKQSNFTENKIQIHAMKCVRS